MLINQKNNILWHKFNGLYRYALVHLASGYFPLYIVNEYPKSGGSWIAQMLGKALDLPFPRNRLPLMTSCIMHGHQKSIQREGRKAEEGQIIRKLYNLNTIDINFAKNILRLLQIVHGNYAQSLVKTLNMKGKTIEDVWGWNNHV